MADEFRVELNRMAFDSCVLQCKSVGETYQADTCSTAPLHTCRRILGMSEEDDAIDVEGDPILDRYLRTFCDATTTFENGYV